MKIALLLFASVALIAAQHVHEDKDWWENAVFYQVYPRSFMDNIGNDGVGDIRGIIQKLDHLVELGVDGFWMNPVFLSPMKDFGYDVEDFYTVHEEYGTNQDLEDLFKAAKEKGLKVILDFVPNHTSNEHQWFLESVKNNETYAKYYTWHEGTLPLVEGRRGLPNNWISVFHGPAWEWSADRNMYYLHQFAKEQPDLNFRHDPVKEEMKNVIRYWLEKGVDGFRVDAINHSFEVEDFANEPYIDPLGDTSSYDNIDHIYTRDLQENYDMVYEFRQILDEFSRTDNITRVLMTEAYANISKTMEWYENNGRKISHVPFNFIMISNLNGNSTATDFKAAVDQWYDNMPAGGVGNWVLGNHDRPRIAQRYGNERVDGMAIMSLLLPGIAFIYYGEEIGMEDNRDISWLDSVDPQGCNTNESVFMEYTRDPVRTPMQWDATMNAGFSSAPKTWLPVHANYQTLNVAAQKTATKSTFKLYQELIKMRKEHTFSHGGFKSAVTQTSVYTYLRHLEDEDSYVVMVNLGNEARTVNLEQVFNELKNDGKVVLASGQSARKVDDVVTRTSVVLEEFEALVVKFNNGSTAITMSLTLLFFSVLRLFF